LIQAFANTFDVESGREDLASAAALQSWLAERGLLEGHATASEADLRQALQLREALRSLLLTNNGAGADAEAIEVLNRCARSAQMSVVFGSDGSGHLQPRAPGVDGALGRLLTIIAEAMANGTWKRLKGCRAQRCRFAFFDRSKNRGGSWCAMNVCGNRTKARTYRRRQVGAATADAARGARRASRNDSAALRRPKRLS
jgi:predicted RNA-binding Zn ribbon-like protein